ncbi:tol-pal system protein YbgF [uncultured Gilliamella sp.]|uniref:tol-pal system protein YbgF n=1 Tax=uncultured Gilliamella sp. TaxID=1193505 RepID=UPI0025EEFD84|nr:tol-pal system protein YbgF [uncultured Gilliamella sp.]
MHKKIITLSIFLLFAGYGCAAGGSESERTVQAQAQLIIQNQQKINDLQSDIDSLRGQLEDTKYQLNQVIERQKMILQQMGTGSSGLSLNTNYGSSEGTTSMMPKTESNTSNLSGWTSTGNDKTDYNFIMQFISDAKQSNELIIAFQRFLEAYPKSIYRANANYWLGQLFYKQGNKDYASSYYATVVKDFPNSSKAGDSLYKVGLILLEKGDKKNAKAVFQQVLNKYSKNKNAVNLANQKLAYL